MYTLSTNHGGVDDKRDKDLTAELSIWSIPTKMPSSSGSLTSPIEDRVQLLEDVVEPVWRETCVADRT